MIIYLFFSDLIWCKYNIKVTFSETHDQEKQRWARILLNPPFWNIPEGSPMKGTHLPAVTLHDSRIPGYWCCKHSDGVANLCLCVSPLQHSLKIIPNPESWGSLCSHAVNINSANCLEKKIIKKKYIYIYTGIPVSVEPLRFFQGTGLEELNFYMWHFINPPIKTPPWPTRGTISTGTARVPFSAGPVFK